MRATCGIDWASDWHDVHITDERGALLAAKQFSHDETGVSELIDLLLTQRVECCAIERPDGLLVGRLLAAGIIVLAIHPNRSRQPESATVPRQARTTASTHSCCASSPEPTATASPCSRPPAMRHSH
jgi:transposase